jgi:hypothetical protein
MIRNAARPERKNHSSAGFLHQIVIERPTYGCLLEGNFAHVGTINRRSAMVCGIHLSV